MERFITGMSVPLPDGWTVEESLTLVHPQREANVIASTEPMDGAQTVKDYAVAQGEILRREFAGYQEVSLEEFSHAFGRGSGWIRRFSWTPPDGVPIEQLQVYYTEAGRSFTATATAQASDFERLEPLLRDALQGLTITDQASSIRHDPRDAPWATSSANSGGAQ
jgi:hypothetical protein